MKTLDRLRKSPQTNVFCIGWFVIGIFWIVIGVVELSHDKYHCGTLHSLIAVMSFVVAVGNMCMQRDRALLSEIDRLKRVVDRLDADE